MVPPKCSSLFPSLPFADSSPPERFFRFAGYSNCYFLFPLDYGRASFLFFQVSQPPGRGLIWLRFLYFGNSHFFTRVKSTIISRFFSLPNALAPHSRYLYTSGSEWLRGFIFFFWMFWISFFLICAFQDRGRNPPFFFFQFHRDP